MKYNPHNKNALDKYIKEAQVIANPQGMSREKGALNAYSLDDIANHLDVAPETVYRWRDGKMPKTQTAKRLLAYLKRVLPNLAWDDLYFD